jgi:beta-glucoside operon transcriptional antiterminator
MRNIKKYNNNIILAEDSGHEVIVLGKGIGFQAAPGAEVDMSAVEKVFIPQETAQINRFADTLSDLAYEYLLLASKIVDSGKEILRRRLNPSILVALADHLSVVFMRYHDKIEIQSPLQWEIRYIYPDEFTAGIKALDIIRQERDVRFPETEAVSIALHFINAELESPDMPATFKIVTITGDILRIVERSFNIVLDENAIELMRFINHVRNMALEYSTPSRAPAKRARERAEAEDDELFAVAVKKQKETADCCERICSYLRDTHGWNLSKNDVSLLGIHITKIRELLKKNEP